MIDLKFGQYPEKYINNKNVSGNFSFRKTFPWELFPRDQFIFFSLSLENNLYLFTQNEYGKSPTRFFSAFRQETREKNQISEEYNSRGVVAFQIRLELSYLDIE